MKLNTTALKSSIQYIYAFMLEQQKNEAFQDIIHADTALRRSQATCKVSFDLKEKY